MIKNGIYYGHIIEENVTAVVLKKKKRKKALRGIDENCIAASALSHFYFAGLQRSGEFAPTSGIITRATTATVKT